MQPKAVGGAIIPSGETFKYGSLPEHETGDYRFDGQFYQTVDEAEYARRKGAVETYIAGGVANMPFDTYQQWVELDWKEPHGTYRVIDRLKHKLAEEAWFEAPDSIDLIEEAPEDIQLRQAAIEELGDVLWVATALTSNAAVHGDQALQRRLWGDGLLSFRVEQIPVGTIDELIQQGLTPYISPFLAIAAEGEDIELIKRDEMNPRSNFFHLAAILINRCEKQFGYNDPEIYTMPDFHRKVASEEVAPRSADIILLVAWYAHHWLNSSLAEVVKTNVEKINRRVQHNLVDKSDGDRTLLN